MNSLEKDLVPYEPSLELKKLGFDESCFMQWTYEPKLIPCICDWGKLKPKTNQESYYDSIGECISAPTFSQAFRWFRDKYQIDFKIERDNSLQDLPKQYCYIIDDKDGFEESINFNSYEKAELACLIKLIEIVKEKK